MSPTLEQILAGVETLHRNGVQPTYDVERRYRGYSAVLSSEIYAQLVNELADKKLLKIRIITGTVISGDGASLEICDGVWFAVGEPGPFESTPYGFFLVNSGTRQICKPESRVSV